MGFMGPKPRFYGSQKPKNLKIGFDYLGLALYLTDPMKKWHLNIRNGCKSPQNPFLGAFMGFYGLYGPKTPFLWVPETSN